METKKSVGIWIRVSTEDQARGESPEHHEKRARYYAEAKGWDVHVVYHLEAVSGKSVIEHPEAKKMLEDIKSGQITGLIFSKLARLARNTKELLEFADYFRLYGADLISLQEAIDTSTPAGRLFYTMIAAMAQWEREEIAERIAASIPIRAKLGKSLGGQSSFGYKWENKKLVIDENEAPIRRLMYEIFIKCKRKKTTANQLNRMGYRTRNGSKFSDNTVSRLLRDTTARGERIANYTKTSGNSRNWSLKPESEWVRLVCPAIISDEVWNACNSILDEQETKRKKPGPRAVHLLAGYLYCEDCDKKLYIYHRNNVYTCQSCKARIAASDIDEIFHTQLKSFLLTDIDVKEYEKRTNILLREKEDLIVLLKKEEAKIRAEMDDLVTLRLNKEMPSERFVERYKPIEIRLTQIEKEIPETYATIDFIKIQMLSSDKVLHEAKNLYERWPFLEFDEKRAIVEVITEKIIIGEESLSFSLSYLPSGEKTVKSRQDFRDSSKQST